MWKCLWVHNNFPVILSENDGENSGGGGGGVEAPMKRTRVERTVRENEKKEKKKKWSELAQRKWIVWKWVVGNGG